MHLKIFMIFSVSLGLEILIIFHVILYIVNNKSRTEFRCNIYGKIVINTSFEILKLKGVCEHESTECY